MLRRAVTSSVIALGAMNVVIACTNEKIVGPAMAGINSALELLSKKEGNQLRVDVDDKLYVVAKDLLSADSANALVTGSDGLLYATGGSGEGGRGPEGPQGPIGPPWSGGGLEIRSEAVVMVDGHAQAVFEGIRIQDAFTFQCYHSDSVNGIYWSPAPECNAQSFGGEVNGEVVVIGLVPGNLGAIRFVVIGKFDS